MLAPPPPDIEWAHGAPFLCSATIPPIPTRVVACVTNPGVGGKRATIRGAGADRMQCGEAASVIDSQLEVMEPGHTPGRRCPVGVKAEVAPAPWAMGDRVCSYLIPRLWRTIELSMSVAVGQLC